MGNITISQPEAADKAGWARLYDGYRAHYEQPPDAAVVATVWSWINDPAEVLEGRVARDADGQVVGLIHFRDVPRPLSGAVGGYIDDIFVAGDARGTGVAEALVGAVADIGRARDWADIRWITADDNYRARAFYDRIARRTMMLTYGIKL